MLGWEKCNNFDGNNAMEKFYEVFEKHNTHHLHGDCRGLQCSVNLGGVKMVGLVCWKDRDMVYFLSNGFNRKEMDVCRRCSKEGLLTMAQPKMILEYNWYMGGVDLVDMQCLHCSLTIMGQNRCWLKLLFYLLDIRMSNALVLFNLTWRGGQKNNTVVVFKSELI